MIVLITCQFNPVWLTFFLKFLKLMEMKLYTVWSLSIYLTVSPFPVTVQWLALPKALIQCQLHQCKSLKSSNSQKLFTLSEMKMCRKKIKRISERIKNNNLNYIHISTFTHHIFQYTRKPLWIKMREKYIELLDSFQQITYLPCFSQMRTKQVIFSPPLHTLWIVAYTWQELSDWKKILFTVKRWFVEESLGAAICKNKRICIHDSHNCFTFILVTSTNGTQFDSWV